MQRSATLVLRLAARQQPRNTAELVDAERDTPERDVLSAGNPQQSLEDEWDAELEQEQAEIMTAHAAAGAGIAPAATRRRPQPRKRGAAKGANASASANEAPQVGAARSASKGKQPVKRGRALQPLDGNAPPSGSARKVTRGMAKEAAADVPAARALAAVAAVAPAAPQGKGSAAAPAARKRQQVLDRSDDDFDAGVKQY